MPQTNQNFIDLHAHLGASTPADILWDLAMEQGINVGTKTYETFIENMKVPNSMAHKAYLSKFDLTQSIQSSLQGIEKSMYQAIANAYKRYNIKQIELRFNPALRNLGKRYDIDAIIAYATFGMKKAMLAYPVKAGIIIETDRTFDIKTSIMLAKKAVQFKNDGVVGFDQSGFTPKGFKLKDFEPAFKIAKAGGLGITVHAGELLGKADEVSDAIQYLYADRIGHGIQCTAHPDILRLASDNKTHFEICPTSNVVTGCVPSYDDLVTKIGIMIEHDISWNLNTDGTEFLNVTVQSEYENLVNNGLPVQYVDKAIKMAIKSSFIS